MPSGVWRGRAAAGRLLAANLHVSCTIPVKSACPATAYAPSAPTLLSPDPPRSLPRQGRRAAGDDEYHSRHPSVSVVALQRASLEQRVDSQLRSNSDVRLKFLSSQSDMLLAAWWMQSLMWTVRYFANSL